MGNFRQCILHQTIINMAHLIPIQTFVHANRKEMDFKSISFIMQNKVSKKEHISSIKQRP